MFLKIISIAMVIFIFLLGISALGVSLYTFIEAFIERDILKMILFGILSITNLIVCMLFVKAVIPKKVISTYVRQIVSVEYSKNLEDDEMKKIDEAARRYMDELEKIKQRVNKKNENKEEK